MAGNDERRGHPGPASGPVAAVRALLAGVLAEAGFDLEEIELRRVGARSVLTLAVDRDGGVDLDGVARASQLVSGYLDQADSAGELPPVLAAPYTLEVASRGVDAPLTAPRHWQRNTGRLVRLRRREGGPLLGRIVTADATGVALSVDGTVQRIDYGQVTGATIEVEFGSTHGSREDR